MGDEIMSGGFFPGIVIGVVLTFFIWAVGWGVFTLAKSEVRSECSIHGRTTVGFYEYKCSMERVVTK